MTTTEKIHGQKILAQKVQQNFLFLNVNYSNQEMEIVRKIKNSSKPVSLELFSVLEKLASRLERLPKGGNRKCVEL